MKNATPILKYLGLFVFVYALLLGIASITSVVQATADGYRAVTAPILQGLFPKAYLELERDLPPESDPHTIRAVFISQSKIEEAKAAAKQQGSSKVNLRAKEYEIYIHLLFTSFWLFLVVLILITPLNIRDKLAGLLFGTLFFYAFSVIKISIFLLDVFNRSEFDMYKLSTQSTEIVGWLSYVLKSLGVSAFVVVFIWILVAFRKSNWQALLEKVGSGKVG